MEAVDVWVAALDGVDAAFDVLSEAERERAERMRLEVPRRRFVASHVVLRSVLARYVDHVELVEDANGKPRLADGDVRFNLSHSGEVAVVAVAGQEVGVDVEQVRDLWHEAALAQRVLAPGEEGVGLLTAWARKEAVVKATGEGLRRALSEVRVFPPAGPWWVADIDVPPGYVGAVAGLGPPVPVVVRRWCSG